MGQSSVPTGEMKSVTILRPSRYGVTVGMTVPFRGPSGPADIIITVIIAAPSVSVNRYFFPCSILIFLSFTPGKRWKQAPELCASRPAFLVLFYSAASVVSDSAGSPSFCSDSGRKRIWPQFIGPPKPSLWASPKDAETESRVISSTLSPMAIR